MLKRFLFKTSKPLTTLPKPPLFSPLSYKFSSQPEDPQKTDDIKYEILISSSKIIKIEFTK